ELSSFPSTASTSTEDHESISGSTSSRKLRVTLLSSEWRSTKGGLSTINRELAIQLAKHPSVEVSVYLPKCSEEDKRVAASHNVHLIEAEEMPGLEPNFWLSCLPEDHSVDFVIGHGAVLGRQVQIIKRHHHCKWIQVVHTAPEELGMYKSYADAISRGEKKHQAEVKLCEKADQVVAVGPKLAEAFSGYLRACGKDQEVLNLTPGIFSEFSDVKQANEERKTFSVLVFGRGDNEDFQLKGYDIAAHAIAELKDEPQPYKLLFVGAPSGEEEKVKDLLLKQGIDRSQLTVRCFNESREQLARLFCEVDLAVMPSRTEGFGLAALEALSAGLPVLVSGNSGLGEALQEVLIGSNCVVESEDPKDWANAIKAVRKKKRKLRLREAKLLQGEYEEIYSWQDHCNRLVQRMLAISQGSAKKRQSSKKGERPLSSSNIPAPKYPRLLKDEGKVSVWDNSVVKLLKAEYKRRSQLRPLLWDNTIELPLENVYTRLKIVSRRKLAIQIKDDKVKVFEIFKTLEKGEDAMTLVEGSPGIGKTTFCLKLAYDWVHGKIPSECSFPKFEFVLLLKCRDIDGNIMDTIREQLLPRDIDEETVEKFLHFMKDIHNQEKILIILDGLDELPEKSQCHVDELLHRRILPFCYVLATSRQERGIDVRKRFVFDIHLEIKGFTEGDAFEYIRKHFANIGRGHSPKGERLITEIKDNEFLHALRSNPLNLLLLCVIYEDYEGKLPSCRSKLYQVIVLCLLRRYCAKHNLQAPEGDDDLERYFEKDILALGELAWMCLLSDLHGFREKELAELEKRYKGLISRHIGLLYKEESLKRLTPQHEYYFLHKTFQEYLAAAYIAHKLRRNQLNLFERLSFDCARILFAQIGEELKNWGEWNWNECRQFGVVKMRAYDVFEFHDDYLGLETASFLTQSFNESGHAEKMAVTLCSYIPFPKQVEADLSSQDKCNIFHVLDACKSFFTLDLANALHNGLFGNTTLSEFTLQICDSIPCNAAILIGELLAARGSLRKVTFQLDRVCGETWASAIKPALFADTPLKSVELQVRGSFSDTAVHGLGKLLSNKALASFSLNVSGDVQEFVTAVISRGIGQQTVLRSLSFSVDGNLSLSGVNALQDSLLENRFLNDLMLNVCGKIPDNWQSVVENLRSVKKGSVNCTFDPDPGSSVTCNQVVHFRPAVVEKGLETKQHLTVVLWGELKCSGAEDLCEILVRVPLRSLTLKVHGKFSDGAANIIKRYIGRQNTLSSLTINIWRKLALGTGTLLQELSNNNLTVQVKEHGVSVVPKEACNALDVSIDNPASLTPMFSEVKNTRKERINLKIIYHDEVISDWPRLLGDALAENTSLTTLDLTVINYTMNPGIGKDLGDSLLRSSSLTVLSLTISNYSNMAEGWECMLINSLAKMTSLTTFSLSIDDRGREVKFGEDLMALKFGLASTSSLKELVITINNITRTYYHSIALSMAQFSLNNSIASLTVTVSDYDFSSCEMWVAALKNCVAKNESLTTLTLTLNDYSDGQQFGSLSRERRDGNFPENTSLTELNLTVNIRREVSEDWLPFLCDHLMMNCSSLKTVRLQVNNHCATGK
ncbi:unnamed protein product, partial [Porites evermanni]